MTLKVRVLQASSIAIGEGRSPALEYRSLQAGKVLSVSTSFVRNCNFNWKINNIAERNANLIPWAWVLRNENPGRRALKVIVVVVVVLSAGVFFIAQHNKLCSPDIQYETDLRINHLKSFMYGHLQLYI